jgi:solute:Na+ symporter, SSS family
MKLSPLDWSIVIGYIFFALVIVGFFVKRASKGTDEYFAAGRSLPWWLLGTSMVATTFSTDTPNLITNLIREKGVSYNWIWWAFLLTGMMTVFFYARLWRRSKVLTDLEFYEIRYAGKSAALVRGFRALYLGLFFNCVILV